MLSLPSPLALLAWVACRTVGAYCVPAVSFPTESLAVQEARAQFAQRTLTTESACVRKRQEPMSEVNALFAYGETELAEAGRQQLAAAAAASGVSLSLPPALSNSATPPLRETL